MLQIFFTQREFRGNWALQGHSKFTTRTLKGNFGTQALGHSRYPALEYLRHSVTRRALGHSGTQALRALGH